MRMLKLLAIASILTPALALGACSDRLIEAPPLGGSIQQNMAAQIVDPNPDSTEVPPPLNGERNNVAQKRYEKGKVLKPANVSTSSTGGSSGGSSSNNNN